MIELSHLCKSFPSAGGTVEALRDISLTVHRGDIYGIIGMSGAGKSTLVRCINMLERPTSGAVLLDGTDLSTLSPTDLRGMRRRVAMIFQSFNLLMQSTCIDNICFPLRLAGVPKAQARSRAEELLATVGLPDKARAYPAQLSGGQKQRIAIARALATDPEVLLCDEATSALDPETTRQILGLLRDINRRLGITVVVITHQMSVVEEICNRVAILDGGTVAEEGEVTEVFSHPKTEAARRLVFPEGAEVSPAARSGERVLRVVFDGACAAASPFIARMAIDEGIAANILYASTRLLGDRVYGNMLLGVPDDEDTVRRAVAYLSAERVTVTENPPVGAQEKEG